MNTTLSSPAHSTLEQSMNQAGSWRLGIPTYIYAVVFSSFCVVMGLLWDIMWHMSIGRDGLFAPPHVVIYVGAVVAGLFSAYQILNLTLTKNHPGRTKAVPFWGVFYGPLGAMFCVWGALAMLTSAPFDDWWHNTYGLDVQILTPPHTILLIGIMTVQFGAMVGVLALQNQYRTNDEYSPDEENRRRMTRLKWLFAISAALLLTTLFTLASESMMRFRSHRDSYYITAAIVLPFYLFAVGRASLLRWPITIITALYMLFLVVPSWLLQLFPATPRLGPVLNPITHYQGFVFPLLLVVPALVADWLMYRFSNTNTPGKKMNDWLLAMLLAVVFMVILLAVQWPFGEFLQTSPLARNWFFFSDSWPFDNDPAFKYRYAFSPKRTQTIDVFAAGFGRAILYAFISVRIGLFWGNWMKRIAR
jgi:hypothetical protein